MQKRMFFYLLATWFFTALAPAQEPRTLDYRRDRVQRQAPARTQRKALPKEMVYRKTPRRGYADARGVSPEANLRKQATQAASWSARHRAKNKGSQQYYQLGFYKSLQQAINTAHYSDWDRREGQRQGQHDRWAGRDGAAIGAQASEELATTYAAEDVTAQFRDLSWRPIPTPRRGRVQPPDFRGNFQAFSKPQLQEVFNNLPLNSFSGWRARSNFENNWGPDAWKLYQAKSSRKVYSDRWRDSHWTETLLPTSSNWPQGAV